MVGPAHSARAHHHSVRHQQAGLGPRAQQTRSRPQKSVARRRCNSARHLFTTLVAATKTDGTLASVGQPHTRAKSREVGVRVDQLAFDWLEGCLVVQAMIEGDPMSLELLLLANSSPGQSFTHADGLSHTALDLAQNMACFSESPNRFRRISILGTARRSRVPGLGGNTTHGPLNGRGAWLARGSQETR